MLKITSNISDLHKKLTRVEKRLPNAMAESIRRVAQKGMMYAKGMAPQKRGVLKNRITRTPVIITKESVKAEIISSVDKPFPYHFWVNEMPGYKAIRLFGAGKARTYGSTHNTGVPGYFTKTAKMLQAEFPRITVKEVSAVLKEVKN